MEGQKFPVLAARTLGIDADGTQTALEIIRGGQDALERRAVILTVDGQKARAVAQLSDKGELEVRRLGDEGDVVFFQREQRTDGIEGGAVIADDHKAAFLRQLLLPEQADANPSPGAEPTADRSAADAAKFALLCQGLRIVDRGGDDHPEDRIQKIQSEKAADQQQHGLSGHSTGTCGLYRRSDDREQHNQHQRHGNTSFHRARPQAAHGKS